MDTHCPEQRNHVSRDEAVRLALLEATAHCPTALLMPIWFPRPFPTEDSTLGDEDIYSGLSDQIE